MAVVKIELPCRELDVAIVDAGGSGMHASLQLVEAGLSVAMLSKVFPTHSHTVTAQGGIDASLGNMGEDNWHYHFYDAIKGPGWLGGQNAIEFMCCQAPNVVYELKHLGIPFGRNADGIIYQHPLDGHMLNYGEKPVQCACATADRTGYALLHTLYQRNVRAKTHFFVEWMALDLTRDQDGDMLGMTALEMGTGEVYILEARTMLFVTDGAGRIYVAPTSAFINTGDGLGMAACAGVPLEDMEFWQFHLTGMIGVNVLTTKGVRGEGGVLRNKDGERFMERHAPMLKDLAPYDLVPRSVDQEVKEGHGCGPNGNYVLLDLTHVGTETITKRPSSTHEISLKLVNIDTIKEPIPVVLTTHYQMGGISTNYHGQVMVPKNGSPSGIINSFYVISECSCVSVYGANRPSTNSLLSLVVFGRLTGNHIAVQNLENREHKPLSADVADRALPRLTKLDSSSSGEYAQDVANDTRRNMQPHVGVFRAQRLMDEGAEHILEVAERAGNIHLKDKSKVFNAACIEAPEVANLVGMAKATMISAAARKESHGAHACSGFPNRDDGNWMKHSLWYSESNRLDHKPIQLKSLLMESVSPKARTF